MALALGRRAVERAREQTPVAAAAVEVQKVGASSRSRSRSSSSLTSERERCSSDCRSAIAVGERRKIWSALSITYSYYIRVYSYVVHLYS